MCFSLLENNEIKKEKCERKKERAACYTEVKYVIERRSYETKKTNPGDAFSGVYGIWGMTPFESSAKESDSAVIDVTEYGVTPDSGQDCAEGIQAALDEAKKLSDEGKNVVLDFPTGRYDIYPDRAEERELYISNTVGANQDHKMKKSESCWRTWTM